jgi:hypothetical protein
MTFSAAEAITGKNARQVAAKKTTTSNDFTPRNRFINPPEIILFYQVYVNGIHFVNRIAKTQRRVHDVEQLSSKKTLQYYMLYVNVYYGKKYT